ncbi:hypothetical protein EMCRGX_G023265 [Ephydatia muelleri]
MNEYGLVLNPSAAPVVISKKVNVGTVEPVQEYCCKVSSAGLQEERNNLLEERIETMLEEAVTLGDKSERQQAKALLRDFKHIIALSDNHLGRTRLLYHHIRSPSANVQDAYHFISIHKCGYWQVELHPKDKEKTAFVTPFGFYQFQHIKDRDWVWTPQCKDAFFELKKVLTTAPVLVLAKFVLDTDASDDGLGAVLSQVVGGREHVVAYASRTLARAEQRYCATRTEMLALVWASQHF